MKSFLSEYGLIIVSILIIIIFIAFAAMFGDSIKDGISGVLDHFFDQTSIGGGTHDPALFK